MRNFLHSSETIATFSAGIAPFVLFAPVILAGKALFWGTSALQFHPWHVYAWETLKSGHLPLWNPLSGLGAPLIANYQSAFFYPPNWIYFLLAWMGGEAAMAWGMGLLAAAHLSLAGVGMVRLARELGLTPTAQTVSGLAFGLSGYLVTRSHFLSINAVVAWLPWILWAVYRLINSTSFRQTLERALSVTFFLSLLLLAGHAQTAWYTLLLAGMWVIFWGWNHTSRVTPRVLRFKFLFRAVLLFALASLLAATLAAIQLLPTAELLSHSQRANGAEYDFVMTYSFWPWRFLGLLAPGLFGSPVTGDYWGYGNFWEDAIYIGLLPLILALRAIFTKKSSTSKLPLSFFRFLTSLTALSFLLALGQNTPIFPFLYRFIPTFDLFQAPTRYSIWAVFALALLAGMGAETWTRPIGKKAHGRAMRGVVSATAVFFGALAVGWVMPGIKSGFIRATILAGALGVVAGVLNLYAPKPEGFAHSQQSGTESDNLQQNNTPISHDQSPTPNTTWLWILSLFVVFDLLIAGWGLNPGISLDFYRYEGENKGEIGELVGEGRLFLSAQDEYDLTFERYLRFDTFDADFSHFRASLLPNLTLLDDIRSANNFDPLRPARYVRWMDALDTADPSRQRQILALMGVTVIEQMALDSPSGIRFDPLEASPRFRWTPCARPAGNEEVAWNRFIIQQEVRFEGMVNLEGFKTNAEWVCGDDRLIAAQGVVTKLSETPNEIHLRVNAEASGWLVIADTWYPGWVAEVDGEARDVLPADYLFRGVSVPPGEHEIVLHYRPLSFYLGTGVSGIMWIFFSVIWVWGRRTP